MVTSYRGGKITNGAPGAQIDQIECVFLQISPANINSGLENKKIPPKKHFLGCKKGQFFWVFTNFRKWRLLIASNPHFREFVNMVGTLSAEGGRRQLANFRKWGLLTASNPHFRKFVKTKKNGPFLRPKKCFWLVFFCFPARNLYWQVIFAKNRNRFGQSGPLEDCL